MADIPFKDSGDELDASDWDVLVQAADAKIAASVDSQPATFFSAVQFGFVQPASVYYRRYFFYPSTDPGGPGTQPDTIAQAYWRIVGTTDFFRRIYDHSPFEQYVASLTLDPYGLPSWSNKNDSIRIARMVSSHDPNYWAPIIWPLMGGAGAFSKELEFSLEAHQVSLLTGQDGDSGRVLKPYWITNSSGLPAMVPHRWLPAEVFIGDIGSSLTWDAKWNKHQIFRFNNLQAMACTVSFPGGHSITVPAMSSKCVRRTYPEKNFADPAHATYIDGYTYFQKPLAGDPWFWQWNGGAEINAEHETLDHTLGANGDLYSNITDPFCPLQMLGLANGKIPKLDFTKLARVEPTYCNAGYAGDVKTEFPMPSGGWFADPASEDTHLGDLIFHKGKILAVHPDGSKIRQQASNDFTVDLGSQKHLLRKDDGTIALGVEDVTISRAGTDIPELSGGDRNWTLGQDLDDLSETLDFYIQFAPRVGGGAPRLTAGEGVTVSFTCLSDDDRAVVTFHGIKSLPEDLGKIFVTVQQPLVDAGDPLADKKFKLTADPKVDLIQLSTNLLTASFNLPARPVGNGSNGADPLVFPLVELFLVRVHAYTSETQTHSAVWTTWEYDDADGTYINIDYAGGSVSVDSVAMVEGSPAVHKEFSLFDTVADLQAWFATFDGDELTGTWHVIMTVFGPVIWWEQSMQVQWPGTSPLNQNFGIEADGEGWNWVTRSLAKLTAFGGNTGWPVFSDYNWPRGAIDPIPPVPPGTLYRAWPRFARRWQDWRYSHLDQQTSPWWGTPGIGVIQEHPSFSSWYEKTPGKEGLLRFLTPVIKKDDVAFVGYQESIDKWSRISAWKNYKVLTRQTTSGSETQDFTHGSPLQAHFYELERTNILANVTSAADDRGRNALPITAEHFNAAASFINSVKTSGMNGALFSSAAADVMAGRLPNSPGSGIGRLNFRPRDQWVWWDSRTSPDTETWLAGFGLTALGWGAFNSGVLQDFLTEPMMFTTFAADGSFAAHTIDDGTGTSTPISLFDTWKGEIFDGALAGNNQAFATDFFEAYRWISIPMAKTLHQALGIPFAFQELAVAADLIIKDADWTQIDSSGAGIGGGGGTFQSRAIGWQSNSVGNWVFDPPFADDRTGLPIIRRDQPPTRRCLYSFGIAGANVLYDADYDELHECFFGPSDDVQAAALISVVTGLVPPTQLIPGHRSYVYRRYGGGEAKAICYPRNWIDFEQYWENTLIRLGSPSGGPFGNIPRTEGDGTAPGPESQPADVFDLTADETVIETTHAYAVLEIVTEGRALP